MKADGVIPPKATLYESLNLLPEMTYDVFKAHQQMMNWLRNETAWNKHVCREIKDKTPGPLWQYRADEADGEQA